MPMPVGSQLMQGQEELSREGSRTWQPSAPAALPPARASSRRCPWRVSLRDRSGIQSKMQRTVWTPRGARGLGKLKIVIFSRRMASEIDADDGRLEYVDYDPQSSPRPEVKVPPSLANGSVPNQPAPRVKDDEASSHGAAAASTLLCPPEAAQASPCMDEDDDFGDFGAAVGAAEEETDVVAEGAAVRAAEGRAEGRAEEEAEEVAEGAAPLSQLPPPSCMEADDEDEFGDFGEAEGTAPLSLVPEPPPPSCTDKDDEFGDFGAEASEAAQPEPPAEAPAPSPDELSTSSQLPSPSLLHADPHVLALTDDEFLSAAAAAWPAHSDGTTSPTGASPSNIDAQRDRQTHEAALSRLRAMRLVPQGSEPDSILAHGGLPMAQVRELGPLFCLHPLQLLLSHIRVMMPRTGMTG